jgi:hypothetical protein
VGLKPTLEWLVNSIHQVVSRLENDFLDDLTGWVCIEGIRNRKRPVLKKLPGAPRVGETLWFGRSTQVGHGKYVVVSVEWSTADFAYDAMGSVVVHVEPVPRTAGPTGAAASRPEASPAR